MSARFRPVVAAGLLWLAACSPRPTATPTVPRPTLTATASATTLPPTETATLLPTATATAAETPTPTITPTQTPALIQLTSGGCCVQPAWSPDGQEVWYLDRPSDASPAGMWGVAVTSGEPRFVTAKLGLYSPDRSLVAYPLGGQTYIERVSDGERWVVPAGGRAVNFSPDSTRIAWQVASSTINFDRRAVQLWVANVDGSGARSVANLTGGGLGDWLPDGARVLVSGRDSDDRAGFIATLNVDDGTLTTVVEAPNLRGAQTSPDGGWLIYQVAFSGEAARDGLWVVALAGGEPRRLDLFGAYRWRSEGRLLLIPLEPGAPAQRLVEIDVATGTVRPLSDPAVTPVRIAGGDWALSPDGRRIVFVAAADHNLWLLELPETP
ncbi:MAG: PD40 domain-containing protein [Anaerolineales bacterium]|nr:PD40 domain-containing protein [Anaerolineales bacterium]